MEGLSVDKYQKAVMNYELRRQVVSDQSKKRNDLIQKCDVVVKFDKDHEDFVLGAGSPPSGGPPIPCLVTAHKELIDILDSNHGEHYSYEEVLHEMACESCIKSYTVKVGPLADAKQAFGNAKRALSAMGKVLMKKGAQNV